MLGEYVRALGLLLRVAQKPTPCMRDTGDHPHFFYTRLVNDLAIYGIGLAKRDRTLARLRALLDQYQQQPATFACTLVPRKREARPERAVPDQPPRFFRWRKKTSIPFFVLGTVLAYEETIRLRPAYSAAHRGLGRALEQAGRCGGFSRGSRDGTSTPRTRRSPSDATSFRCSVGKWAVLGPVGATGTSSLPRATT